jgi:hypothetical protein
MYISALVKVSAVLVAQLVKPLTIEVAPDWATADDAAAPLPRNLIAL